MAKTTPIRYTNFTGMLNMGASHFLSQDGELAACKNCYMYKKGVLEKVPGYIEEDANQFVSSEEVDFLHFYHYLADSQKRLLIAGSNNAAGTYYNIKYLENIGGGGSGGYKTFTGDKDLGINSVLCAANYLNKAFIVGHRGNSQAYVEAIPMMTVEGTTLSDTSGEDSDLLDAPTGRYIVRYKDLLYVLNASDDTDLYPNRAYYNDYPVSGAITWSNTVNFLDFGQDDGDEITGAGVAYDRLVVFKNKSMWTYDTYAIQKIAEIGCVEHRTIKTVNSRLYWSDGNNIYQWSGGEPVVISDRVKPLLDAIDKNNFDDRKIRPRTFFAVDNAEEYRLYIGTVTHDGITYTNTWICYDTVRNLFYIRCTYDAAYSACSFLNGENQYRTDFGSSSGYTYLFSRQEDGVYSDNGNEIDSFFETHYLDFGYPETTKLNSDVVTFAKHPNNMTMRVKTDYSDDYEDRTAVLSSNITKQELDMSGNLYKFRFNEKSSKQSWSFMGFVVNTQLIEDYE